MHRLRLPLAIIWDASTLLFNDAVGEDQANSQFLLLCCHARAGYMRLDGWNATSLLRVRGLMWLRFAVPLGFKGKPIDLSVGSPGGLDQQWRARGLHGPSEFAA